MAEDHDIAEHTDSKPSPVIPHTFVLEPGPKIFGAYSGYRYWDRPSTAELQRPARDYEKMPAD